jgi:2-oxoglutarate dehydrogenase E2 component (dihydrolipoamide succinyltransferase)
MSIEIKVPGLPESVSEATVATWHKKTGERVARDENLVDLETDKVVLEVPAPAEGVMGELLALEGDSVTAEQVIGILLPVGAMPAVATEAPPVAEPASAVETPPQVPAAAEVMLSPAARRVVEELGLDPTRITGSGPGGRVLKEDALAFHAARGAVASTTGSPPPAATPVAEAPTAVVSAPVPPLAEPGTRPQRRVPMTRLRQRIAERLVQAQQTAAMLTTFNEVNMQPIMELRSRYRDRFEKTHDVRLGFMSFFVKAAIEALKRFPAVNASIDGSDILYHGYHDIGIAVSTERGLVVPVLRDADQLGFAAIEAGINDFGRRAQAGKLSMDELTGGTFSITNGGVFGSLLSTPILNPPQSAILGMHKIQERPVAEQGAVVIRPMMYLALSYDHRIVDGKEAVSFLVTIKDMIEDPARMLLEV